MLLSKHILSGIRKGSVLGNALEKSSEFEALRWVLAISVVLLFFLPGAVLAEHLSWHKFSKSYEVYLGVVSAATADQDGDLRRMHKVAPHGKIQRTDASRHIMVAVFRQADMARLVNAEVTAKVVENDLIHVKRQEKALELMQLSSGASYCNFFHLHWNGRYRIDVDIREPGKSAEHVTFYQEEVNL